MSGRSTAVSAAISGLCSASVPIQPPHCQTAMLHFSLMARDKAAFDGIRARATAMGIPVRDGRLIASVKTSPGQRAFCLQDPDRHWIEIIEEQRQ